jgi:hypothetical protein
MTAVSAGLGVVSGIAGMAAKNKEAAAQAQAAADQRFQAQASAWAQQRTLSIQADTAQKQHSMSVLQALSDYSLRETGLKAQRINAQSAAVQQNYANDKAAIEGQTALANQVNELNVAESQVLNQQQQQLGAADVKTAQMNDQIRQALMQTGQQASQQQKQAALLTASRRPMSESDTLATNSDVRKSIVDGLAQLLNMDQEQAIAEVQNMNESDMADISAALGLNNVDFGRATNAVNQRVVGEQQQFSRTDTAKSLANQQAALDAAQINELTNYALSSQSNQQTYDANRGINTVQQQSGIATANSVDASLKRAQDAPRGAGFLDYVNLGAQAYSSFSPFFGTRQQATPVTNNMSMPTSSGTPLRVVSPTYSGFVPGNNA